ncbi:hypothetical protein Trydic_g3693 [Trypoxylus dichotomus]
MLEETSLKNQFLALTSEGPSPEDDYHCRRVGSFHSKYGHYEQPNTPDKRIVGVFNLFELAREGNQSRWYEVKEKEWFWGSQLGITGCIVPYAAHRICTSYKRTASSEGIVLKNETTRLGNKIEQ